MIISNLLQHVNYNLLLSLCEDGVKSLLTPARPCFALRHASVACEIECRCTKRELLLITHYLTCNVFRPLCLHVAPLVPSLHSFILL